MFAVVELWSPISSGRWFVAGDIGQLAPLTTNPTAPARAANPLQTDVYTELAPFLAHDARQVRAGHLPQWNPYNGSGQPFLANYQSSVFSPFTWPFYVLGFRMALLAAALARLWLLGFFTFLFLARHRIAGLAAAVGGIVFMFAGYHVVWQNYPIANVSVCLPASLWCTRVALDHRGNDPPTRRRRRLALGGLTVSIAAMLLGGNPETAVFCLLLVASYVASVLAVERRGWRDTFGSAARFAGAAVLAAAIAAVQLVPFAEYEHGSSFALMHHTPIPGFNLSTLPMLAFPNLFGGPQFSYYDLAFYTRWLHPLTNYAELNGNAVGLFALCLAPLGLAALRRRKREVIGWWGLGATVVGTLLLYSHAAGAVWERVPGLGTAYLNRSQDIELMGLATMTALGTDWVLRRLGARRTRPREALLGAGALAGSTLAVGTVLTLWALHLRTSVSTLPGSTTAAPAAVALAHDNLSVEVLLAAGVAVALVVFGSLPGRRLVRSLCALAVVGAAFASIGIVMRSYNPAVDASVVYPRTQALRGVESVVGSGDTLFAGGVFIGGETSLWFPIHDVSAYDSVGLHWHDELYRRVFSTSTVAQEQMPRCLGALQLFGVQWIVGGDGHFTDGLQAPLRPSGSVSDIPYYSVPGGARYALVSGAVRTASDDAALARVTSCRFDPQRELVVDAQTLPSTPARGASGNGVGAPPNEPAGVHEVSASPGSIVLDTTSATTRWLVVRQSWAPGWHATVDGHSAPLVRADVAFDAVALGPGRHRVRLWYQPGVVTVGEWISIGALAVLVGYVLRATLGSRVRVDSPRRTQSGMIRRRGRADTAMREAGRPGAPGGPVRDSAPPTV